MDDLTSLPETKEFQAEVNKAAAGMQSALNRVCFELPATAFSEATRFASQRLQAQSEFFAALKSCHSMPDFFELQSRFVRKAIDDYGSETSKVMENLRSAMNKAA